MVRRPPRVTRTDTLVPDTTLVRATVAASPAASPAVVRRKRPNILLIMSDQERGGDDLPAGLGLEALEGFAARGTRFTNFNVNTTPCSPSRSNLYTGQHTQLNGVITIVGALLFPEARKSTRPTTSHFSASRMPS